MKHFPIEDWFDFARRVLPPGQGAVMQRHLDDGCEKCLKLCEIWRTALAIAGGESRYQPAESAVRIVKAAYLQEKFGMGFLRASKIARLIFDSSRQPVAVGVRNSVVPTRHLLFEAGRFRVDLRLEAGTAPHQVSLVGQVLNSENPAQRISGVDAVLLSDKQLVAKVVADALGEFYLEFAHSKKLRLFIGIPGQSAIGVPLPDLRS